MTNERLLASIGGEGASLDTLGASLSDAQMMAPELDGGWSVKDVLAHISAWELLCLKWIGEGRRDEGPFTQASIDAFNDGIYQANRERALPEVLDDSRRSHEAIVHTVEELTRDLNAPPRWASDEFTGGAATATLGEIISANSDEHYREHIDQIDAWLEGLRAS